MTMTDQPTRRSFGDAVKWSILMNIGNQLTNTIAVFVIAGILGPEAFGTVALAIVFLLFAQLLLEQGLTTAIIQRKDLSDRHIDTAFWILLATSVVLLGATLLLAGWFADLNDAPDLASVLRVMSPIIIIEAFAVVQRSLLQRDLDFKQLALRANTASVIGGVVGVTSAIAGAGIWALVAQQLVTKGIALVLFWQASDWRPSLRFSGDAVRDLMGFSGRVFFGKLGTFTQSQVDALIIGVAFGPVAVGLYRLALRVSRTIVDAFSQPVAQAALPAFSRVQDDPDALDRTFRDAVRRSAGLVIPVAAGVAAVGEVFLRILGPEWAGAGAVLVVLAVLAAARSVNNLCGPMLLAVDRPGTVATLSWGLAVVNIAMFLIVAWTIEDDVAADQALAMAVARTAPFVLLYVPVTLFLASRAAGASLRTMARELAPVALSVPLIVGASRLVIALLDGEVPDLALLLLAVAAGGVVVITVSPAWRQIVIGVIGAVRRRLPVGGVT